MRDKLIRVEGITKDYGGGKGIFDINLNIRQGEVFGLVGVNGSGKTTIIRHLMGFIKPDSGRTSIAKMDCWECAAELKKQVGYVPGEIAFPEIRTGTDFLKLQAEYLGMKKMNNTNDLVERFNLDTNANLRKMSKGMKQKTAIVNAFMANPQILLLDEPTTGLDPLMQQKFIELVNQEKKKGKTIFMSSHIFEELESTCDRVAFLKNGEIIDIVDLNQLRGEEQVKKYKIGFTKESDFRRFLVFDFDIQNIKKEYLQVTLNIPDKRINELFHYLKDKELQYLTHIPLTLEKYFLQKYSETESA